MALMSLLASSVGLLTVCLGTCRKLYLFFSFYASILKVSFFYYTVLAISNNEPPNGFDSTPNILELNICLGTFLLLSKFKGRYEGLVVFWMGGGEK